MYSIGRIERETGISKDVLRMWERRYGFPMPMRVGSGERNYSGEDLERLLLIKRLMDLGHRPGRLMSFANEDLLNMLNTPLNIQHGRFQKQVDQLMVLLIANESAAMSKFIDNWLIRYGLEAFILELLPTWMLQVGYGWQTGSVQIHHEHLLTDLLQTKLRLSAEKLPVADTTGAKILLTTLPGELHGLSLLMLENLCRMEGFQVANLGIQTPVEAIFMSATELNVNIVCLSIAETAELSLVDLELMRLRQKLPETIQLWLGGEGAKKLDASHYGATYHATFDEFLKELARLTDKDASEGLSVTV